jgi:hypothetical protein
MMLVMGLGLALSGLPAHEQESWSSGLLGRDLVLVEKTPLGDDGPPRPLPPTVAGLLGSDSVEYESFVATRLPAKNLDALLKAASDEKLLLVRQPPMPVTVSSHAFSPSDSAGRSLSWSGRSLQPASVPGLFLMRFAFPILPEWLDAFAGCGVHEVLYLGNGDYLVRAPSLGAVKNCKASRYLAWAGPYLTTDRFPPELLDEAGDGFKDLSLQFLPGVPLEEVLAELPAAMQVLSSYRPADGQPTDSIYLRVLAGAPELEALARTSETLLSAQPTGESAPSDERQGQIVAGNHNGTTVTATGYAAFLTARGLDTSTNQQTVAFFDTGFDDGSGPGGTPHPDLAGRLVAAQTFTTISPSTADVRGHGTMVAGIIAGNGIGTGKKDAQGFYYGMGIAPQASLVLVKVMDWNTSSCNFIDALYLSKLDEEFQFARSVSGQDRALISNHSWNNYQKPYYNDQAQFFDARVVDADSVRAGHQPMTIVVSAGNDPLAVVAADDSILPPALAKNVIAVGSTQSYRPSTQSGAPPLVCGNSIVTIPTEEANNITRVSKFSRRGAAFGPGTGGNVLSIRVKPDLVAPGGRVFSTVPYDAASTYTCTGLCFHSWPNPPGYHSIYEGTSFSAPVVTGVAALTRKWFLDRGTTPSPSLIKAAMIATADDLGQYFSQPTDHRPSNDFGWGRVNLDRLTARVSSSNNTPVPQRFYISDSSNLAVATGISQSWTRTIDDPTKPTYIGLAWSDPASAQVSGQGVQAALVNDLALAVDRVGQAAGWRGNNFNENSIGVDDGYSFTFTSGFNLNDTANNVEAVFIPANTFSAGQQVTIRVTGVSVPVNESPNGNGQRFAIYGYNVRPSS